MCNTKFLGNRYYEIVIVIVINRYSIKILSEALNHDNLFWVIEIKIFYKLDIQTYNDFS